MCFQIRHLFLQFCILFGKLQILLHKKQQSMNSSFSTPSKTWSSFLLPMAPPSLSISFSCINKQIHQIQLYSSVYKFTKQLIQLIIVCTNSSLHRRHIDHHYIFPTGRALLLFSNASRFTYSIHIRLSYCKINKELL